MNDLKPCPFCGSDDIDYGVRCGTMRGFDYIGGRRSFMKGFAIGGRKFEKIFEGYTLYMNENRNLSEPTPYLGH